jgi:ActR/RegA family two-component response regulator
MRSMNGAKRRVLLVEDDDGYRYVLARELRAMGFDVLEFRTAMEALDCLDRDPTLRQAVVDLRMPACTLTGMGFARMMRYRNREAKVVLMTGVPEHLDINDEDGFGTVLYKDSDTGAVASRICQRFSEANQPARAS